MADEVDRRLRECSALDAAGRERWHAEQRRLLDETAQFLSTRGRDKVRAALDTAAWSRTGRPGAPPDRNADLVLEQILATERLRSAGALTVAVVATVPLML